MVVMGDAEAESWKEEFRELARLAGADMPDRAFDAIFDLCQLRVVPHATLQARSFSR